jgi:alpha/beta superfamily hydrolase
VNAQTERLTLTGLAGAVEALRDAPAPDVAPRGVAIIAHPHPLFGGTMDNKVVQTLARAFVQCGYTAVRFNFRGVGASAGEHDAGIGEAEDMLAVVRQVAPEVGLNPYRVIPGRGCGVGVVGSFCPFTAVGGG